MKDRVFDPKVEKMLDFRNPGYSRDMHSAAAKFAHRANRKARRQGRQAKKRPFMVAILAW